MPSNRVVTYIDINLNSVEEYWAAIVVPSVQTFRADPSTKALFHAAGCVWHLHDWVWHDRNPGVDTRDSLFASYRSDLLRACPELGWLRDITDASKHRGLGRQPEVKGAEPQMVDGYASGLLLAITQARLKFFLVLNDGTKVAADDAMNSAVDFWQRELSAKTLPSP